MSNQQENTINKLDVVLTTILENAPNTNVEQDTKATIKRKYTRKAKVVQADASQNDQDNSSEQVAIKKRKYTRKAKVEQGEGTHDPAPKRRHVRINPVHNLTFDELLQGGAQETIQEVELTKEQREKMVGLAYEKLNDKYYRVKYLNLDLIMDVNGYCNATNMCHLGGKEFKYWKKTNYAKECINELRKRGRKSLLLNCDILYQENSRECDEVIRGTYVHPDLIVTIGMWVSREFGFKVQSIVRENILRESAYELRRLGKCSDEEKSLREIAEEARLKAEIREQKAEEERREAQEERKLAEARFNLTLEEWRKAEEARVSTSKALGSVTNLLKDQVIITQKVHSCVAETSSRSVPTFKDKTEMVVLWECYTHSDNIVFQVSRIGKDSYNSTLARLRRKHQLVEELIKLDSPNAVNLWQHTRENLSGLHPNRVVRIDANTFEIDPTQNESRANVKDEIVKVFKEASELKYQLHVNIDKEVVVTNQLAKSLSNM